MLQHLATLIPCDVVCFCDFDVASRVTHVDQECIGGRVTTSTAPAPVADDPFFRYYWTTPMCSYPSRTGDGRSVIMRTDFMSDRQWHADPMYLSILRDDGLDHDMLCCLRNGRTRSCRVIFARSGMPFSERERQLLALLRPVLAEGLLPAPAPRPVPLTARAAGAAALCRGRVLQCRGGPAYVPVRAYRPQAPGEHLRAAAGDLQSRRGSARASAG